MQAFRLHCGVSMYGPTDSGKAITAQAFASRLGRPFLFYNCTHRLNHRSFSKLLKGIAATGSWACLHAFDRVAPNVMSSVAEMVAAVQRALLVGQQRFRFGGTCPTMRE